MKILHTILLFLSFVSLGLTQNGWQLDSVSQFLVDDFGPRDPYFAKYTYNAEGERTRIESNYSDFDFSYGVSSATTVRYWSDGQISTSFRNYDGKGRLLHGKFERKNPDDILIRFDEEFYTYENDLLKKYVWYRPDVKVVREYLYEGPLVQSVVRSENGVLSNISEYEYDNEGRLIEFFFDDLSDDSYIRFTYTYDSLGELVQSTNFYQFNSSFQSDLRTFKSGNGIDSTILFRETSSGFFGRIEAVWTNGDSTFVETHELETTDFNTTKFKSRQELQTDINFSIHPNPVQSDEYVLIDLRQNSLSRVFIFDELGRKIQELGIGGKRRLNIKAPSLPGQYFVVFMDENGNRSQPKAFQVF